MVGEKEIEIQVKLDRDYGIKIQGMLFGIAIMSSGIYLMIEETVKEFPMAIILVICGGFMALITLVAMMPIPKGIKEKMIERERRVILLRRNVRNMLTEDLRRIKQKLKNIERRKRAIEILPREEWEKGKRLLEEYKQKSEPEETKEFFYCEKDEQEKIRVFISDELQVRREIRRKALEEMGGERRITGLMKGEDGSLTFFIEHEKDGVIEKGRIYYNEWETRMILKQEV